MKPLLSRFVGAGRRVMPEAEGTAAASIGSAAEVLGGAVRGAGTGVAIERTGAPQALQNPEPDSTAAPQLVQNCILAGADALG